MKTILKKRRSIAFILMIIMCMSTLMFTISADTVPDNVRLKDGDKTGGVGRVSASRTFVSATTESGVPCNEVTEYLYVNFTAYTGGTTVFYPLINGSESSSGSSAYGNNVNALTIINDETFAVYTVDTSHRIVRDGYDFQGAIIGFQAAQS